MFSRPTKRRSILYANRTSCLVSPVNWSIMIIHGVHLLTKVGSKNICGWRVSASLKSSNGSKVCVLQHGKVMISPHMLHEGVAMVPRFCGKCIRLWLCLSHILDASSCYTPRHPCKGQRVPEWFAKLCDGVLLHNRPWGPRAPWCFICSSRVCESPPTM